MGTSGHLRAGGVPVQESCSIVSKKLEVPGHYSIKFSTESIARNAIPGQFVQIRLPDSGTFLPRPFSFLRSDSDSFEILFKVVGIGTKILSDLPIGTELNVIGPLGNGFDFSLTKSFSQIVFVAGGVGIPPLIHVGQKLRGSLKKTALIGAVSKDYLLFINELSELGWNVKIATDDGSHGHAGFITDLLEEIIDANCNNGVIEGDIEDKLDNKKRIMVLACGPYQMLRKCAVLTTSNNVWCQVAMEQPMACGFGVCLGCALAVTIPTEDLMFNNSEKGEGRKENNSENYALVCRDGPVFNAKYIKW